MMPLADAARELGVAPVTLRRWRKQSAPPHLRADLLQHFKAAYPREST